MKTFPGRLERRGPRAQGEGLFLTTRGSSPASQVGRECKTGVGGACGLVNLGPAGWRGGHVSVRAWGPGEAGQGRASGRREAASRAQRTQGKRPGTGTAGAVQGPKPRSPGGYRGCFVSREHLLAWMGVDSNDRFRVT